MGKPRMIILVRHAQSEGNKNRDIHQYIPDHRVQLTPEGHLQAEEAGRRLRSLLRPDDTLHFFTSPYRRTRETTEGMLKTLTSDDPTPSPWKRSTITVYEEPRLREQDFGNFQPCSAEMERMWQERADYGHFFYRIPNGESAADAYDRVAGFNESLWRQFGEENFPSVCVLVTHGLMTRVFLMKWYHWSVEYFEDLRNVNHCEFIIMKQTADNGKYVLDNELRTWSDLKKRAAATATAASVASSHRLNPLNALATAGSPARKWGGCVNGCNHTMNFPRKTKRMNTLDFGNGNANANGNTDKKSPSAEKPEPDLNPSTAQTEKPEPSQDTTTTTTATIVTDTCTNSTTSISTSNITSDANPSADNTKNQLLSPCSIITTATNDTHDSLVTSPTSMSGDGDDDLSSEEDRSSRARHLTVRGRDFGGSLSGVATPAEGYSDDSDCLSPALVGGQSIPTVMPIREKSVSKSRKEIKRTMSHAEWEEKSGMGLGRRADALGDGANTEDDTAPEDKETGKQEEGIASKIVDGLKEKSQKSFDEIY